MNKKTFSTDFHLKIVSHGVMKDTIILPRYVVLKSLISGNRLTSERENLFLDKFIIH